MLPFNVKVRDLLESIEIHHCNKQRVPNYDFITTIHAANHHGHILKRTADGCYVMCLSTDDGVRYDADGYVYGFHRATMADLEALAATFTNAQNNPEYGPKRDTVLINGTMRSNAKLQSSVKVTADMRLDFSQRINGVVLTHIGTGNDYPCTGKDRKQICLDLGVGPYALDRILYDGVARKGWIIKAVGDRQATLTT